MFEKNLVSPTKTSVIPGAGPQLPNDGDRGRVHYIWEIFNPDTVKKGEESRYVVPREREMVFDPLNERIYRVDHVAWESDLRSTLTPIFNWGGSGSGDSVDDIFGMPAGFQGEGIIGIDYSVRPNRAVVDGQIMAPGAAYALLYEGNNVGETGKIISVVYSNSNQIISNRIPCTLAVHNDLTNKEIMVTQPFSVNRSAEELPNGARCTLVWYDLAGNVIPRARSLSVQHTALLRDHQIGKRYIRKVELVAPWFLNSGDPETLYVPVNTMLQNLAFRAVVHYSDGSSSDELPIDGKKILLHGLNEHKVSTPGQRSTLTLIYNLDEDESIYEAQSGSPDQYRSSYWLMATAFDGAYSPKLYSYPTWVNDQYVLKHYLADLDRDFIIDATEHVRINEQSPAFRPTTYGVEQTLDLNLRLSDVVPTFKPMIMRQSTTFILKGPGNGDGSKYDVRYSYDSTAYSDATFKAINQADGRQELTFGGEYSNMDDWLDQVYYAVEPGYNPQREKGPLKPTHFEILATSGKTYEFEIGQYAEKFHLDTPEPQGRSIFVRWLHRTQQDDLFMLATTGVTIDVIQGPTPEDPVPTTIEFDSKSTTQVGEGGVITFSGIVYDQKGTPIVDGLHVMKVMGGTQYNDSHRDVAVRLDGSFRMYTYSDLRGGNNDTFKFGFINKEGEMVYLATREVQVKLNTDDVKINLYPYTPVKCSISKAARVYGFLTNAEGVRLPDTQFHSYVNDNLETFQVDTTDENGDFLLTRLYEEGIPSVEVGIITPANTKDHSIIWMDEETYGDRITLTNEDMVFVGDEMMSVTGLVYDQFGTPVGGARCNLGFGPNWASMADDVSDPVGNYTITGPARAPGDTYDVVVWTENDFKFATVTWEAAPQVAENIVLDEHNVTEAPAGTSVSILGKLVDADGNDFTSDRRTPVYMREFGDAEETIIYAGFDGRFEAEVGPYGNWEETTFIFRLNNDNTASHKITWVGEPAKLATLTFDEDLPVEGHVGVPVTLEGGTVDQYGDVYAPGVPFEIDVIWGDQAAVAQGDGNGRWSFTIIGTDKGSTTYTFKSNNTTVGSHTINFTGSITISPLPNCAVLFNVPLNMSRTIGWYVLDEAGTPKPGVQVTIRKSMPTEEVIGTFTTDQYGIVEYDAPYHENGVAEYKADIGGSEERVVVSWKDSDEIIVTTSKLEGPDRTTLSRVGFLVKPLNQNGDIFTDPHDIFYMGVYDRKTFERIPTMTDATEVAGEFIMWVTEFDYKTRDLVFYTEVNTYLHTITWVPPTLIGATIAFNTDYLMDAAPVGQDINLHSVITQANGERYQPRAIEQLRVVDSNGVESTANIYQDGTSMFTTTSNVAGEVSYTFGEEGNVLGTFTDILWTDGGTLLHATYSNTEVPVGSDAHIGFALLTAENAGIPGRHMVMSTDTGDRYRVLTNEFGIANLTIPAIEGEGQMRVTSTYNGNSSFNIVKWVGDAVKTPVTLTDMQVPEKAAISKRATITGKLLDKDGLVTNHGEVGVYHLDFRFANNAQIGEDGTFTLTTVPYAEAGEFHFIVYGAGVYAEYAITWDADFVHFDQVGIDAHSNDVVLISK